MFADVRHDIYYPAPALILATERNNTRATEAHVEYDHALRASSRLDLLAIRRDDRLQAVHTSSEDAHDEVTATETTTHATNRRAGPRCNETMLADEPGEDGTKHLTKQ